jgi:hypothetical protein
MTWKHYLGITIVSLFILLILASFQSSPGYMDAEYYYSMGLRIASNHVLTEPFIWNYLASVDDIPHPGFSYWMPIPAFFSAFGIWISGLHTFTGGRIFHLLLAAFIPAPTMKVTWEETWNSSAAGLAGLLAIFPVFYNIYFGTTDSFAIVMILGGIFFLLARAKDKLGSFFGMGAIAGLMHLTRADGLIWVIVCLYCAFRAPDKRVRAFLSVITGYLVIMVPWFARNWLTIGTIMPSGLSSAFWFREYNDLFLYSSAGLNYQTWISEGIVPILRRYQESGLANLKTALFVQGQIILAPFILLGAWRHRRSMSVQSALFSWLLIFVIMSFVFPFAGIRGGYFHSSAAYQTIIWCLAASGFFIDWGVDKRNWTRTKAGNVFGALLVSMVALAAIYIYVGRVIGNDISRPAWNESFYAANEISAYLNGYGLESSDLVMINNPPGFYAATGMSSIVIPSGPIDDLILAGNTYGAKYLVLEQNHPGELDELYNNPDLDNRLEYLGTHRDAVIFKFTE